jgi:hypothetical protein
MASPKSAKLMQGLFINLLTKKLRGLMSLWTIPWRCTCFTARAACLKTCRASVSFKNLSPIYSRYLVRSPAFISFVTMKIWPCSLNFSTTSRTFSCELHSYCACVSEMPWRSLSQLYLCLSITLMATWPPFRRCLPRKTSLFYPWSTKLSSLYCFSFDLNP